MRLGLCVHMFVCACAYVCVGVCVCLCVYNVCVWVYTCVHMFVCGVYVCAYVYLCMCVCVQANAGDSRAIACVGGCVRELSHDHKPNLPGD